MSIIQSLCDEYLFDIFPLIYHRSWISAGSGEEKWIVNKVVAVYLAVIMTDYPTRWPSAFTIFTDRISSCHSKIKSASMTPAVWQTQQGVELLGLVETFLQLLLILDSELIADEISSRTEQERALAMTVKDGMRNGDTRLCLSVFARIFDGSLFGLEGTLCSCLTEDVNPPDWWADLAALALKALAKMSAWIDTALLVSSDLRLISFYNVVMLGSLGEACAEAGLEAFQALTYKKMEGVQKTMLMTEYSLMAILLGVVEHHTQASKSITSDFRLRLASVVNVVGIQVLDALEDIYAEHLSPLPRSRQSSPNASDAGAEYKVKLTTAEADEIYRECWSMAEAIAKPAIAFFASDGNAQSSEMVIPFLQQYFRIVKTLMKDPSRQALVCNIKETVARTLGACVQRVQIPRHFDWESFFEKEDDFFLADEDDGSEESLFFVCRKQTILLFRKLVGLAMHCESVAIDFATYLTQLVSLDTPPNWRQVEATLTLFSASLDAYKDTSKPALQFQLIEQSVNSILAWQSLLRLSDCPSIVRVPFFESLGKVALYFKAGAKLPSDRLRDQLAAEGLKILVSDYGVKSGDSPRAVSVAVRELLRFHKAMQPNVPELMASLVKDLAASGYLQVSLLPPHAVPDSLLLDEYDDGVHLTKARDPMHPCLSVDDQSRLLEFVGSVVFPAGMKQSLLSNVLAQLLTHVDSVSKTNTPQKCLVEWMGRVLRGVGNLLKGFSDLNHNPDEVNRLLTLADFSINVFGACGRVQQNVVFILRRIVMACQISSVSESLAKLFPMIYSKLAELISTAVRIGNQETKVVLHLNNIANLISHIFQCHSDQAITHLFARRHQGASLLQWTVKIHFDCWRDLYGSREDSMNSMEAQNALQEAHTIVQTMAMKAPHSSILLAFVADRSPPNVELCVVDHLIQGTDLALETGKLTNFTAGNIQAYTHLLAVYFTDPAAFTKLQNIALDISNTEPLTAVALNTLAWLKTNRDEMINTADYTAFRLPEFITLAFKCVIQASASNDPPSQRVIEAFALLLRFIWTGKIISPKNVWSPPPEGELLPLQKVGLETLAINAGESTQQMLTALRGSDSAKGCKDVLTAWLRLLQAR